MATKKPRPARAGYTTLEVTVRNRVGIVSLNRPDVHNAFDEVLIAELTEVLPALAADDDVRVVLLAGNGHRFAGGCRRGSGGGHRHGSGQCGERSGKSSGRIDRTPSR